VLKNENIGKNTSTDKIWTKIRPSFRFCISNR